METDSSGYVSSGQLFHPGDDGLLHPIVFFSTNLNPAECNHEIYHKELSAITKYFEQWRPELEARRVPVKAITDNRSFKYFITTKKLTGRQAPWAEFLLGFNFIIS